MNQNPKLRRRWYERETRPRMTPEEMAEMAAQGRRLAAELSDLTDQMNAVIARAERVFVKIGLTFEATVPLTLPEESASAPRKRYPERTHALTFRHYKGSWRLLVESCDDKSPAVTTTLLTSSSRRVRLGGMRSIPDLHMALLAESDDSLLTTKAPRG